MERIQSPTMESDLSSRPMSKVVTVLAIAMSLYHFATAYFAVPMAMIHRPLHALFAFVILFLINPLGGKKTKLTVWIDFLLIMLTAGSTIYLIFNAERVTSRLIYVTPLTLGEIIFGSLFILIVLEATRRVIGKVLMYLVILFLLYGYFGKFLPYPFWHKGYGLTSIIEQIYLTLDGAWGVPLYVTSTYVFLFILFGSFLVATGTGDFFTDFARAVTGRMVGGPAKTAVVSSALMGTLSGSSVANVVTTGAFTIPMMKKQGYAPHFAAAVEAAASSGGQVMPPVMGAAAFIMVEFTGIQYAQIMMHALLPAFLYFFAIFLMVDIEARRLGLRGLPKESLPSVWGVLRKRGYLFIPILAIIYFLVEGFTPSLAAFWGIVLLVILAFALDPMNRNNIVKVTVEALTEAPKLVVSVTTATAAAGIIVGIILMTGLGLRMTKIVLQVSGGELPIALFLTMVVALILGMGMPSSSAYIIMAALLAPGLIAMDVPVIAAHMFAFYFACMSSLTPPVALASYAGAGVAGADPMKTGFTGFRLGIAAYIVPFMFVYGPSLLLIGEWPVIVQTVITSLIGIYALASSAQGWLMGKVTLLQRLLLFAIAIGLIYPGLYSDVIGVVALGLMVLWRRRLSQSQIKVSE